MKKFKTITDLEVLYYAWYEVVNRLKTETRKSVILKLSEQQSEIIKEIVRLENFAN